MVSSIGGFAFGASQILFVIVLVQTVRGGAKATGRVWDTPFGLEWQLPSPAPYHSWAEPPSMEVINQGAATHDTHG
jgi:cytochrome c oxidase subunit 1